MAVKTYYFRYRPTAAPSGTEDRVLACSHTTDDCSCVINSSGQIGYYVSFSFIQMGTKTLSIDETYHSFIIQKDDSGNGSIYVDGQKIGSATNFPTADINQIGNYKTELLPEDGRLPSDDLRPRDVSNIYTRPCCGDIDEVAVFDRALSASEIVDLSQSGSLSKVYTLADYKITAMADNGIIATTEKPRYLETWRATWDEDQRVATLPTAILAITTNGTYKSLATAANDAGIWTPSTSSTAAYNYYVAVESWRKMFFVSSGGGTGFLLTAQLGVDTDISSMSPTLESRQSALMYAEDALRSAIMTSRQSLAETNAVASANSYTDDLETAIRLQTDHVIVFTTNTTDPSTGWTDEEKLIHIGDYWRSSSTASWKTWSGTAWVTVSDAAAIALANAAQSSADGKSTVYATLELAKASSKSGDSFFYAGCLYVCTSALAATATRYTYKDWENASSNPSATTQTVSGSVLTEPLVYGDTYFNTSSAKYYKYTTSWVVDSSNTASIVAYTPKYLGRYLEAHPSTYNNGDWWLVYGLSTSAITRGFWYSNNGTPALVSSLSDELQRKYRASGLEDVLYASNNGYALDGSGVYVPETIYGVSIMSLMAANVAFINNLFAKYIKISGCIYGGSRYDSSGAIIDYNSAGFYLGANGVLRAGKCVIDGLAIFDESLSIGEGHTVGYQGMSGGYTRTGSFKNSTGGSYIDVDHVGIGPSGSDVDYALKITDGNIYIGPALPSASPVYPEVVINGSVYQSHTAGLQLDGSGSFATLYSDIIFQGGLKNNYFYKCHIIIKTTSPVSSLYTAYGYIYYNTYITLYVYDSTFNKSEIQISSSTTISGITYFGNL